MSAHPPRPRLVVRVGITGHRWNKLKRGDADQIRRRITEVLQAVQGIAERIGNETGSGYRSPNPDLAADEPMTPELRLVSALAEGADRLLVEAAPLDWSLQAILPFPVEIYARDFTEPNSLEHLERHLKAARAGAGVVILDGRREAENAFEAVGNAVCLNSDLLIAVWDGLPGKPGGTADIVDLAVGIGVPVVRIAPDGSPSAWLHRPEQRDRGRSHRLEHLGERLRRLLVPPGPPDDADDDERDHFQRYDLREKYFREKRRRWQRGQFYGFVLRLLSFRWNHLGAWWREVRKAGLPIPKQSPPHYGEAIRKRWNEKWKAELGLPDESVDGILRSRLPDHYGWASHLAGYYAGRYRNTFLWGYLLSWIAVLVGALGLVTSTLLLWVPVSTWWFGVAEVGLLLGILILVARARSGKFHERWLAYRSLTEGFRSLTYTLPFGRASTLDASGNPESESWVDWLHRAVVREIGLPAAVMSEGHLREARKLLLDDVLREQVGYHARNAATLAAVDRRLHRWTKYLFFVALGGALLHLIDAGEKMLSHEGLHLEGLLTALGLVGITVPAMAASAHGFLSQGEFENSAERSRRTRRTLEELRRRGMELPLTSEALGNLATEAAQAMDEELGSWFAAYRGKGVTYP